MLIFWFLQLIYNAFLPYKETYKTLRNYWKAEKEKETKTKPKKNIYTTTNKKQRNKQIIKNWKLIQIAYTRVKKISEKRAGEKTREKVRKFS